MKFDKEFEEDILSACFKDIQYLRSAVRVLDMHHFHSPQHGWVWKCQKGIWEKYREQANGRLILSMAAADFKDDDERALHIELVKKLAKRKVKAPEAKLHKLTEFVKAVNAQIAIEQAVKQLEKGKIDECYKVVQQLARNEIEPRNYLHVDWIDSFEKRMADLKYRKEHPEEFPRIPTGFKRVDKIMSGGAELREVGMVLGTTGRGKSICLSNMAFSAVKRGFPSVYFAMEMPATQVAMRQDARWLGIAYHKFKEYDFTSKDLGGISDRLKKIRKRWTNKLHIISMPVRSCNIHGIVAALDDLKMEYGFVPKALFIDSADHLNAVNVSKQESFRLQQASVYWDIKNLATHEAYMIWTSTHAGREYEGKIAGTAAAAESYDKSRIVDIALSLNIPSKAKSRNTATISTDEDEDEIENEAKAPETKGVYMTLKVAKYRDGASQEEIPIDADFAKMHMAEVE